MHWLEPVVTSAGVLSSAVFAAIPIGTALMAVALALFTRAEFRGVKASVYEWAVPGVVMGALIFVFGSIGWIPVVFIATFILSSYASLPNRLGAMSAVVAASAVIGVATAAFIYSPIVLDIPSTSQPVENWLAWTIVFIFALLFLFGWVFGQQFLLFPWIGFGMIAATGLGLLLGNGAAGAVASFTAFLGYGICGIGRLLYAHWLARKG